MGYLDHPHDPVPNIGGMNTMDPVKILRSLGQLYNVIYGGPQNSPHTFPYAPGKYKNN